MFDEPFEMMDLGTYLDQAAFPTKLRGGSAGWVRPVALVSRSHFPNARTS